MIDVSKNIELRLKHLKHAFPKTIEIVAEMARDDSGNYFSEFSARIR
jgi:hypothetical protein